MRVWTEESGGRSESVGWRRRSAREERFEKKSVPRDALNGKEKIRFERNLRMRRMSSTTLEGETQSVRTLDVNLNESDLPSSNS